MRFWSVVLCCIAWVCVVRCDITTSQAAVDVHHTIRIPQIELNENDLRLINARNGTLLADSVPYSGYLVSHHLDGTIASRKSYLDGRLEGEWVTYFTNGNLESKRSYKNGEKHGNHLGYFVNGVKKFQYYFENGFAQGKHFRWYADGRLACEMSYVNGHELGAQKVWRPDGKMRSNYVVKENGRRYGLIGLKRCAKIDSETENIDPYKGS